MVGQTPQALQKQTLRAGVMALLIVAGILVLGAILVAQTIAQNTQSRQVIELVNRQTLQAERLGTLLQNASIAQNERTRKRASDALKTGIVLSEQIHNDIHAPDMWGQLDARAIAAFAAEERQTPLVAGDLFKKMTATNREIAERVANGDRISSQLYRSARQNLNQFKDAQLEEVEVYQTLNREVLDRSRKQIAIVFATLFAFLLFVGLFLLRPFSNRIRKQAEAVERYNKQLETAALQDSLTQLPNRTFLASHLEAEVATARERGYSLAVAHIDLDLFKEINDTHGHAAGDQVLVELSERMKGFLGPRDVVARVGGDEFLMVLPRQSDSVELRKRLKSIIAALCEPVEFQGASLRAGASIGVALFPATIENAADLVVNADLALYDVKEHGRGSYRFYHPDMRHNLSLRQKLESELRLALDENSLTPFFQPQVNMVEGKVVGLECLVRWHHPKRGLISPGEFLPVAETTGEMVRLGRLVTEKAICAAAHWHKTGITFGRLALNASSQELREDDFADWILETIAKHGLPGDCLTVEILETVMMDDVHIRLPEKLNKLRKSNVMIELDDFGTGFASLQQIRPEDIDGIKIDRVFINGLDNNYRNAKIVEAMVELAASLQINILAEGAETRAEVDTLLRAGCATVQGYCIAKPMPEEEVAEWVMDFEFQAAADAAKFKVDTQQKSA